MDNIMMNESRPRQNVFIRIVSFSWIKKSIIVELISLLFVILFLYTGISKLLEFTVFEEQLAESPVLGPVASLVAWSVPIIIKNTPR
jgi:hypothetical protein